MSTAPPRLALQAVTRQRAGRHVLGPLTLQLAAGEVLGLLGVNGAGKSTALMLMAGVLAPGSGQVMLDGMDLGESPRLARVRIGYLPEQAPLWPELTVTEQLDAHAHLRGLRGAAWTRRRAELLERLDLGVLRRRLCALLSLGQRQRVGLACALAHAPALLLLDEPGNGLDPLQAARLHTLLAEHARAGACIVISTHLLGEVQAQCSRVAILHDGLLRHDAPIHDGGAGTRWRLRVRQGEATRARVALAALTTQSQAADDATLDLTLRDGVMVEAIAPAVLGAGLGLRELSAGTETLGQTFAAIAAGHAQQAA